MPGTSFKNYVVNYDLVVNSTAAEGFAQVSQMAQRMQKPLKDISNHFKRLQQSASALKKGGAFEINPTVNLATFDKQAQTLVTKAEKLAAQVSTILNGAFTIAPSSAKTTGGKGTKGSVVPSKTERRTYTTEQLKKEAESVKKQLKNLYGPRGTMSENTKGYKGLLESLKGDVARLADLKRLRTQLAAINADIKAAGKNGGKITKTITDGVAQGVVTGTKKGGKKLAKQPQVTEAFNGVLQNLVAGKAVQVPVSVVANAKTVESVNAALTKMRGQIKPIVVPITVATNIDAAKAVRSTVEGLQSVITGITPSSTGKKSGGKGTKTTPTTTTPVAKTAEQKALEKELRGLQSEQNKYAHWKQRHDEWQKRVAELRQNAARAQLSDAQLQQALEKVLYTDRGRKRLVPVKKPKLKSLSAAETEELNRLTLATDPLIQQKAALEQRLAALKKSAGRKALTGKQLEEAKSIQSTLLPQINKQLEAAGESRRAALLKKQAGYAQRYEAEKKAYDQWVRTGGPEKYQQQLDREAKALTRRSVQRKIEEAGRTIAAVPTTKLPTEPRLAEGIRTTEQIEARRAEITQRLEELRTGAVAPTTGKKGKGKGKASGRGAARTTVTPVAGGGIMLPISESIQQLQALASEKAITLNLQMAPITAAQTQLTEQIAALQTLANEKAILFNATLTPTVTTGKKGKGKGKATGTTVGTTTPVNTIPFEGVVENIVVSKSVKVTGGPVKVEGLVENVKAGKGMKPMELKANVVAPGLNNQVNVLRELSAVWKALPKTGSRTYTVNLKMPGIENIGKLRELAGMVGTLPQSQRRVYNNGIGKGQGGRGTATTTLYGSGGRNNATRYMGRPKGTMNTFAYQLMGNTSLGARTPVFLDMMKGMGMMSGVGAAMSTLTDAFSNASEYQNTMVTARSILEANYQGGNFATDFANMERIVRDVAKKTKFTAPQAADAARFMAMAGLNIPMINASIRPIADVAVIGDNDLGEVADKITNIQTAFGIQPSKMRALADALTKTFTSSNTDMMMLAESMEYAAPMAHLAGAKVEDALAMIGIMGNAGIQGSMAGTTLRMMYQNVINPNKKQQALWNQMGVSLKDSMGNPRQLIDILNDLRQKVRISKEDKDEEGRFKDEGTPIAEAVSRLFRVTASAGAGTLIENLDKVIALAEANRNAEGLSQRISEVKQNDVKGLWAKMTSAFTDAVVTEFESNENPIKGYIENLTKYFNSPDFKDMLHDIFDLVTSMLDTLGTFAEIWKGIYDTCGGLIKYVLMAQFWMTQIGYLIAPLRSVWLTITRGIGLISSAGNIGAGGAAIAGSAGMAATAAGGAMYASPAVITAQKRAARFAQYATNSKEQLAALSATHAANSAAIKGQTDILRKQIAKRQMQWYIASRMDNGVLNRYGNSPYFWNMAYTNPEAAAALSPIGRKKAYMGRAAADIARKRSQIASLMWQERSGQVEVKRMAARVSADETRAMLAHREAILLAASERKANRVVNRAVLNRAVQMGKLGKYGKWTRDTILLRQSGSMILSGLGLSGMFAGIGTAAKGLFAALTGPIGLTTLALGALTFGIYKVIDANREFWKKNREWQQILQADSIRTHENVNKMLKETTVYGGLIDSIKTINVTSAEINVGEQVQSASNVLSKDERLNTILEILSSPMDKWGKWENVTAQTIYDAYNTYLDPYKKYFTYDEGSYWGHDNNEIDAANITKALVAGQVFESRDLKNTLNELHSLATQYQDPNSDWQEYLQRRDEIINRFNPARVGGLIDINTKNFKDVPGTDVRNYKTWYETMYNYLNEIKEIDPILRQVQGLHNVSPNKPLEDYQRWKSIIDILSGTTITGFTNKETGVDMPFTIPMGQYGIDWGNAFKYADLAGVETNRFAEIIREKLGVLYDNWVNDPKYNYLLKGIERNRFVEVIDNIGGNFNSLYLSQEEIESRARQLERQREYYKSPEYQEYLRHRQLMQDYIIDERTDHPIRPISQPRPVIQAPIKPISQTGYSSTYGVQYQPLKLEGNTTIQKIEVNITNNGELDERKVAEMVGNEVGKQVPQHMYSIIQPTGGLYSNWG